MAAVVDLNGIKTELQSIFNSANTTTASPIDLSNSLTRRVQKVLSVHPEMIPVQASWYPFVTCYVRSKSVDHAKSDIGVDQLQAKRKATINIDVVGAVFNQNTLANDKDPADTDINYLMENVEYVLRTNPTLNSKVKWQLSNDISYYTAALNTTTHVRAGVLSLSATIFY